MHARCGQELFVIEVFGGFLHFHLHHHNRVTARIDLLFGDSKKHLAAVTTPDNSSKNLLLSLTLVQYRLQDQEDYVGQQMD